MILFWVFQLKSATCQLHRVQEQLSVDKVNASFEIGALFLSPKQRLKKRGNFKSDIVIVKSRSCTACTLMSQQNDTCSIAFKPTIFISRQFTTLGLYFKMTYPITSSLHCPLIVKSDLKHPPIKVVEHFEEPMVIEVSTVSRSTRFCCGLARPRTFHVYQGASNVTSQYERENEI